MLQIYAKCFFFLPILPSSLTAGEDRQKKKGLAAETFFLPILPSSWLGELAYHGGLAGQPTSRRPGCRGQLLGMIGKQKKIGG